MLNLSRLRMLVELHRRGTLARVAEALSYSPSAVSQQLTLLERETGVQLFEHVGRRVRLTQRALILVEHAEAVLDRLEQAETELVATEPQVRGTLRVASFQTVVLAIAPAVLDLLAEQHPGLSVEFTQHEVAEAYSGLSAATYDLILGEEFPGIPEPHRPGVDRVDLLLDPLLLAVPRSGPWSRPPTTLTDLADHPWALDPAQTGTGQWVRSLCRTAGFEPHVRYDGPDPLMHAHLVRTGHAVAIIPALIAEHIGDVRLIGLPGEHSRLLYTAARASSAHHPGIEAFRVALAASAHSIALPEPEARLRPSTTRGR